MRTSQNPRPSDRLAIAVDKRSMPVQAFDATDFLDALARTASPGRPF
jgi:hypothetical protein